MSGRIRTLKPEWLEDEALMGCSSDARVLSAALLLLADDYGNGRGGTLYLSSRVFPGKSHETLTNALEELRGIRYALTYEVDGQHYFAVRNWTKHQKVQHPGKPLVPAIPLETNSLMRPSGDPPENLTPDRRPGPTTGTDDQRPGPTTTTRVVVVASDSKTPEPEPDPGRETLVPLDLQSKLEANGSITRLAEQLGAPIDSVRDCISQFVMTWHAGKLAGQKRSGWPGRARQWVIDQNAQGKLKPPGAVSHGARNGNGRGHREDQPEQITAERSFRGVNELLKQIGQNTGKL